MSDLGTSHSLSIILTINYDKSVVSLISHCTLYLTIDSIVVEEELKDTLEELENVVNHEDEEKDECNYIAKIG